MTTLGWHNAHLTSIQAPDTSLTVKWSGDVEANLFEQLLEGDDRMSHVWRSWLTIPSNVPVTIEPGDFVFFDWNGVTHSREVRDMDRGKILFGIIRLHFADR